MACVLYMVPSSTSSENTTLTQAKLTVGQGSNRILALSTGSPWSCPWTLPGAREVRWEGTQYGRRGVGPRMEVLSLLPFPGLRAGTGGLALENLDPTMVPWSRDGLARNCGSRTSKASNFLGRCRRKLALEIETFCSPPFLQTPDDLEIQTMLLTFPGATEAAQNWPRGQ